MKKKNTLGVARTLNTFGVFKDHETDWTFKRTLGYMGEQGAQIGECLYAASRINERVPESWMNEWAALGAKVEAQGAHSLEVGNNESARDSFIRASNYYRTAEYGCPPSHPRFHELWRKGVECMHKALPLFERPAVPVSIPYEGKMMPGYFVRPDESGAKRPTLILVGGNDSTIEEILLIGGIAAARRGFNFLTFDYPGHRGFVHTYYPEGTKRVDNVPAFKAAIDFLLTLPGVDDRIALSGGSMGGYVVTQVAYTSRGSGL
ncbi:MAG: alpha/beta hydrolase family protein [Bacillota bacterium]